MHALIFLLLGPTPKAIHVALLGINLCTVGAVGWVGRRYLGDAAGLFAAAAYGTFTLGTGMFGYWLSAEHFSAMFLAAGAVMMPGSFRGRTWLRLLLAGVLLGSAPVIKQHAALPAVSWLVGGGWLFLRQRTETAGPRVSLVFGPLLAGFVLPVAVTWAVMAACGVFENFRFWAFEYALQYVTTVSLDLGWRHFLVGAGQVFRDAPVVWILTLAGIVVALGKPSVLREPAAVRILLAPSAVAAMLGVSAGLLFRPQYFILLAPYAALLAGLAWQLVVERPGLTGSCRAWVRLLLLVASFGVLIKHPILASQKTPEQICRHVYGMNPFPEYPIVADWLRRHTGSGERVAVIGSEPAIYFLADRPPATPYLCVYEMMKPHAFANRMQREAIGCIEQNRPRCMVIVDVPTSWGRQEERDLTFETWLRQYGMKHYSVEGRIDLVSETEVVVEWGNEARSHAARSPYTILMLLRND